MSMRSQQLKKSIAAYLHTHNKWVDDKNRPNPDESYWDAVEELLSTFDHGDIPQDCRDLANAVDAVSLETDKFDQRQNVSVAMPGQSFWTARESLEKLFASINRPAEHKKERETVQQLAKEGVGHEQIARMWGLVDDHGKGKAWLIEKELASPGSVITAKYVHPDDVRDDSATDEVETVRSGKLGRKRGASDDENKPCPEKPRELWEQHVGVPQAARMLLMKEVEVKAMWESWDVEHDQQKKKLAAEAANKELAAAGK